MQTLYRVRRIERTGKWIPEHSRDGGVTWSNPAFKSYKQRGWAQRICQDYLRDDEGYWEDEGDVLTWHPLAEQEQPSTLTEDDKAKLTRWKELHQEQIERDADGLSDDDRRRLKFLKWEIERGKISEFITLRQLGLEQCELFAREGAEA